MNVVQYILVSGIRLYRWAISPAMTVVFGPLARCRYTPTCSAYAMEAIRTHGALAGSWMAIKRIGRCNPWGGCGEDPVPQKKTSCGCAHPAADDTRIPNLCGADHC